MAKAKRPKTILVAGSIALLTIIIVIAWPSEDEPIYRGKKLSQWLQIYPNPERTEDKSAAEEAVRQIGTNALPRLLKWIGEKPPAWSRAVGRLHASWEPAKRAIEMVQEHPAQIALNRWRAASGFEILGNTASNAVPALVRMLDSDNPAKEWPPPMWPPPAYALARIGNDGLKPLLDWVSDPRSMERNGQGVICTARALGSMGWNGTNADLVISTLAKGLSSKNKNLALSSALGLSSMNPEPDIVVPALSNAVKAGNGSSVWIYLECLERTPFTQTRVKAILLELQKDPDPRIQIEVKSVLNRLASETVITNRLREAER